MNRVENALMLKRTLDLMEGLHARLTKEAEQAEEWDKLRLQNEAGVIKVLVIMKVRKKLTEEIEKLNENEKGFDYE